MNQTILCQAANEARGIAIDAVRSCQSGHLGLPLGAAEMGAVLFGEALQFNPKQPDWINRDRFILSAGHGSLFLYTWLHLVGYDLSLEDIRQFRTLHSKTPGHPESFMTPGVEATTGPLGQGIGNAVGMAVSAKMLIARLNGDEEPLLDYHVVCLAGDGCIQEGIAAEASAFAGHFGLDNLILIYDSNDVTLDAAAEATQSENTSERYRAYGFDTQTVDGHDLEQFLAAFQQAKAVDNGKPQLIIAKTEIGKGITEVAGTAKAHGEKGASYAETARSSLGLPETPFYISEAVRSFFDQRRSKCVQGYEEWQERFTAWKANHPDKLALLEQSQSSLSEKELLAGIPFFESALATRKAGSICLQPLAKELPWLISGSADLHGSTLNYIEDSKDFSPTSLSGRNIRFGIREHGMGAILNGIAYDGYYQASGATFTTFSDYMRPAIRLAALSQLPVFYIFTHDSVGVGEDGPTHQPVEVVNALRLIPNLDVIRPADGEETAAAFVAATTRKDGPTALILTRQEVPNLDQVSAAIRREGTLKGGYIARREEGSLHTILLANGSELQHALKAAEAMGDGIRVVSLPCFERFDRQTLEYQEAILPATCRRRIAIEAGTSALWWRYVGLDGKVVGIDRFGFSAPGGQVMETLGITSAAIVESASKLKITG